MPIRKVRRDPHRRRVTYDKEYNYSYNPRDSIINAYIYLGY